MKKKAKARRNRRNNMHLTPAQLWKVLDVVFGPRHGICLTLDQLVEVGLLGPSGSRWGKNIVTKALHKLDRVGYYWARDKFSEADLPRRDFIRSKGKQA